MKPLEWIGSSKRDLDALPPRVQNRFGFAFHLAQIGDKHHRAKPLLGFGGASVLEIAEDFDGETYRAVYTVRFEEAVYVLHCFQKKSRSGVSTPKGEMDIVRRRLKEAQTEHECRIKGGE